MTNYILYDCIIFTLCLYCLTIYIYCIYDVCFYVNSNICCRCNHKPTYKHTMSFYSKYFCKKHFMAYLRNETFYTRCRIENVKTKALYQGSGKHIFTVLKIKQMLG